MGKRYKSLYSTNNRIAIVDDTMDYSKQVNKMPYEKYGDMLTSGELLVIRFKYDEGYVLVSDRDGNYWKVTYQDGFLAVLTRVDDV